MTLADAIEITAPLGYVKPPKLSGFRSMAEREYHRDPAPAPSFSASLGKVILDQSPAHAYLAHPRLGGSVREPTSAMEFGTLVHKLILGEGASVVSVNADSWKTSAAKQQRDEARAAGKLAVLASTLDEAAKIHEAFRKQYPADQAALFNRGDSERVLIVEQPNHKSGDPAARVFARGMLDRVLIEARDNTGFIWDIKTCADASPEAIERTIYERHYDMQMMCYEWLLGIVRPELSGRITTQLIFIESAEPYSVVPVELDSMFRQIGRSKLGRAWDSWCQCCATGIWPSYTDKVITLGPPTWAASRELDDTFSK